MRKTKPPPLFGNSGKTSRIKTVIVFGSGPIRIGQGIEFDYASVHCVWALKAAGYEVVIVNNNPRPFPPILTPPTGCISSLSPRRT